MEDGLAGCRPGVEDHPVAAAVDALGFRHPVSLLGHFGQQAISRPGQRREVRVMRFRYDQHVRGGLWIDIAKCNRMVTFGHEIGWDLASNDLAKEAFCHRVILACGSPERRPTYMVASLRTLGARHTGAWLVS
jgi:hypothetical protein